jgi:deoxyribose-phosphate aldolase
MKYKEYAIYDLDYSESDIKLNIEKLGPKDIEYISVPYFYTKFVKSITDIPINNAIDYPFGILDTKTRNQAIINAINNGASSISIVLQNNLLSNKKYDKIRQDLVSNIEICKKSNIPITYYLEYRVFTHQSLIKACNLLLEASLDRVYVSTGYLLDDISDNIIAVNLLKEKTNIKPIFTANVWTKQHIAMLKKNNIELIRFNNLNAIKTYYQFS